MLSTFGKETSNKKTSVQVKIQFKCFVSYVSGWTQTLPIDLKHTTEEVQQFRMDDLIETGDILNDEPRQSIFYNY